MRIKFKELLHRTTHVKHFLLVFSSDIWSLALPSFELDSSCGYDSLADVVISSSISPIMVSASDDVVLGTDLARGGFCRFPSAMSSLCGGFITLLCSDSFFTSKLYPFEFMGHLYFWLCSIALAIYLRSRLYSGLTNTIHASHCKN